VYCFLVERSKGAAQLLFNVGYVLRDDCPQLTQVFSPINQKARVVVVDGNSRMGLQQIYLGVGILESLGDTIRSGHNGRRLYLDRGWDDGDRRCGQLGLLIQGLL
jgi:hypothetical protein